MHLWCRSAVRSAQSKRAEAAGEETRRHANFPILVRAADPQREGRPGNRSRSDTGGTATRASPSWSSPWGPACRLTPALGEPAPAKLPSPALPFPVRADGRETFLSNETEVFHHDRSPPTAARQPSRRASLTRMSNELTSLRVSVNKLAWAQNALLFNVKALSDQVQSLSGTVQQMTSTMNGKAGEDVWPPDQP
jgi:hypothetical protein